MPGKIVIINCLLLAFLSEPFKNNGQVSLGILPVTNQANNLPGMDGLQNRLFETMLQDYLEGELSGVKAIKFSKEHILLTLKGFLSDPENLPDDAIREICKKERLSYLLKCTLLPFREDNTSFLIPVEMVITDNIGKIFWQNDEFLVKMKSTRKLTADLLMDASLPVFQLIINEIAKLKY